MPNYLEPGYSAFDFEDGDLTASVNLSFFRVDGGVLVPIAAIDTGVAAEYRIHYEVSDSTGNSVTSARVVNIQQALNAVPTSSAFLFTAHAVFQMVQIDDGTLVDQIYDPQYFELKYEATGVVIATGTNAFDFLVSPTLDEKNYVFTVNKGQTNEQSTTFEIIHYPLDEVNYSELSKSSIDFRILEINNYRNDERRADSTMDLVDWGVTNQLVMVIDYLIEEGKDLRIYNDGILVHTIPNAMSGVEYLIPSINPNVLEVEYDLVRYGHVYTERTQIPVSDYKNVINRANYGTLSGSGISDLLVLPQSLNNLLIEDSANYSELSISGINNLLVIQQSLTIQDEVVTVDYGLLSNTTVNNYLVIQQSNTEVN